VNASAILCTHNPRPDYFRRCLDALRGQTLPRDRWGLVMVDNRSDEPLAARADVSWHPTARVVREEALGLTPARLRGIREATGDLFIFVDDDNVLDADFLETALGIAEERPLLGTWSGQCRPEFEEPPPEWTRRYWGNLAIREFEKDVWSNLPRLANTMPCGAGLCVRRSVALHYLELHHSGRRRLQFDRTGDSLMSGGDNDLAGCACDLGMGIGLISALKLTHLIPPQRLTLGYLTRLVEGIQFSSLLLDAEYGIEVPDRGYLASWMDRSRLLRVLGPHREIMRAVYRGRTRALEQLKKRSNSNRAGQ